MSRRALNEIELGYRVCNVMEAQKGLSVVRWLYWIQRRAQIDPVRYARYE